MPQTLSMLPPGTQQITHDPTKTINGDPMGFMGDNPFGTMTEEIIFGAANTLLSIVDDVTGLDLLPAAQMLEGLLPLGTGGAGFPGFLSYLSAQPSTNPLGLPTPGTAAGGMFTTLISWVTSGFGLLDGSLLGSFIGAIPGASGVGLGGLGSIFGDWLGILGGPTGLGSGSPTLPGIGAIPILGGLFSTGLTFFGSLIPLLDASKISTGTFGAGPLQPLIDVISLGFGGTTGHTFGSLQSFLSAIPGAGPVLDAFVTSWLGIAGSGFSLPTLANALISVPARFLTGALVPGQMSNLGVGTVSNVLPELLANGNFDAASSLIGQSIWNWDGTQGPPGVGTSVFATADGTLKELFSNAIPVAPAQVLNISGWTKGVGVTGAANSIALTVQEFANGILQSTNTIGSVAAPSSSWTQLTSSYTVPTGIDTIFLRPVVLATATAGTVWFGKLSVKPTATTVYNPLIPLMDASKIGSGQFPISMITNLATMFLGLGTGTSILSQLLGTIPNLASGLTGLSGLTSAFTDLTGILGSPTALGSGTPVLPVISSIPVLGGLLSGGTVLLGSLIPLMDASKISSGVISEGLTTIGLLRDALFGGFGGTGTGATNTQAQAQAAVVTANAASALASAISAQTTLQQQQQTIPPGGINVTYSFSGADGTLLSATDFTTGPTNGDIRYRNNGYIGIRSDAANGYYWMRTNTQFQTDEQSIAVVLGDSLSTNQTTLLLRSDSALAAGAYCHVTYQGVSVGYYTFSGGTWSLTQLASISVGTNTGQRVEFRCYGLNYYVLVNGVQVLTVTDSGNHVTRDASHRYAGGRWLRTSDFFGTYDSYRLAALILSDFAGVAVSTTTSWRLSRSSSGSVALSIGNGSAATVPSTFFAAQDYATNVTVTTLGSGVITIVTAGWYELTAAVIALVSTVSSNDWVPPHWAPYVNGAQATGPIPCGTPVSVFLNAGDTVQPGVVAVGDTQSNTGVQTANSVAAGATFGISTVAGYASWTGKYESAA